MKAGRAARGVLVPAGLDLGRLGRAVRELPRFALDFRAYSAACRAAGVPPPALSDLYPMLADRGQESAAIRDHYFWQDLWAARKIYAAAPNEHFDIGSRVDGFILALLAFRQVTVIDIRPLPVPVTGLRFVRADASSLDQFPDGSVESISSLHAVEHFGLGRYGDPLDPAGSMRAMKELARVCRRGGRVYFSVPVGRQRTCFNAHRVFSPDAVVDAFGDLDLVSFAGFNDGEFVASAAPRDFASANYACGMFEFTRR